MTEVNPLLVHSGGKDFLKSLAERVLAQLMKFGVTNRRSRSKHERADQREGYRNGYQERPSHTHIGTLDVRVPKLRQGTFSNFLEPRRLTKKALTAAIQEAWIGGISTRKVDDLV